MNPRFATTVVPQRPTDDGMGNTVWADLPPIKVVVWLGSRGSGTHSVALGGQRGPTWTEFGQVFAPRGSDLKSGDRVPYQGLQLVLSGTPTGDQVHALTGHDFGWMSFNVEGHR
jgi:hypothetical protein